MTRDDKVNKIAQMVAQGGWSSIQSLADKLSDEQLEDYYFLWEEDEDDEP